MSATLHLTVSTPATVLVDETDVRSVRAEDESGGFGILPGHTDLLTSLPASVLRWRGAGGVQRYCVLRSGVLMVTGGNRVSVACRRGAVGDDLSELEAEVHAAHSADTDAARQARVEQMRLHARVVRQLMHYLRPGSQGDIAPPGLRGRGR